MEEEVCTWECGIHRRCSSESRTDSESVSASAFSGDDEVLRGAADERGESVECRGAC